MYVRSNNQKWYDKPISKLILITIALTWIFPVFGFVLSSFRPGESIKRESWWDAIYTGKLWTELTLANYSEIFFADNLDRSFYNSFAVTIPSTIIPITIAAFAAYAFAFMEFRGKEVLFLFVVALCFGIVQRVLGEYVCDSFLNTFACCLFSMRL